MRQFKLGIAHFQQSNSGLCLEYVRMQSSKSHATLQPQDNGSELHLRWSIFAH